MALLLLGGLAASSPFPVAERPPAGAGPRASFGDIAGADGLQHLASIRAPVQTQNDSLSFNSNVITQCGIVDSVRCSLYYPFASIFLVAD
jgi:hypothetical protein